MDVLKFAELNSDSELNYIVTEGVRSLVESTEKVTRGQCCDLTAKLVFETINERYPEYAEKFSEYEIVNVARDIFHAMSVRDAGYLVLYPQIATRLLHYMSVRLMGVQSSYVDPSLEERDSYSPFGQEGGFCNPMKLKILGEN